MNFAWDKMCFVHNCVGLRSHFKPICFMCQSPAGYVVKDQRNYVTAKN